MRGPLSFAILVCGEDLQIRTWNEKAAATLVRPPCQGDGLADVFPPPALSAIEAACRRVLAHGETAHARLGGTATGPATICPIPRPGGKRDALIVWRPEGAPAPEATWVPPVAEACVAEFACDDAAGVEDETTGPCESGSIVVSQDETASTRRGTEGPRSGREVPPSATSMRARATGSPATACAQAEPSMPGRAQDVSESAEDLCRELESIESLVDSLARSGVIPDTALERLRKIQQQSSRARALVDRTRRALAPAPAGPLCPMQEVAERIRARLEEDLARRGARIHLHGQLPHAAIDPRDAESLFEGLVRFGLADSDAVAPRIEIGCLEPDHPRADPSPGHVTFFVADNAGFGGGMATGGDLGPEASDARAVSSAGAGLALARRTVERHGGSLWLELDVGRGSRAYFTLPCGT